MNKEGKFAPEDIEKGGQVADKCEAKGKGILNYICCIYEKI
jgi:hypothetical protein